MTKNAWLTPDASILANPQNCRTISVPGDLFYLVTGCLELLAESENWEEFGTATPDEMAQYFRDVIDEHADSRCGMKFIESGAWLMFSDSGVWGDAETDVSAIITENELPEGAKKASALWARVDITFPRVCDISVSDLSGEAVQLYRTPSGFSRQQFILPMQAGGAKVVPLSLVNGDGVSWSIRLVGWW